MKLIACAVSILLFSLPLFAETSEHTWQPKHQLNSLSYVDVQALLSGKGMGFTMAAELNHFPGPRHVLDLQDQLGLTGDQLRKTQLIFTQMNNAAVVLGEEIVHEEQLLDKLFATDKISHESLKTCVERIAKLAGELRYTHLLAHLSLKNILSAEQIKKYDQLRGYETRGDATKGDDTTSDNAPMQLHDHTH